MKMEGVKQIAIVGTGMIATSLAVLTTGHGYPTVMLSLSEDLTAASKKTYDGFYEQMIQRGLLTREQAEICARYLSYTMNYRDLAQSDVAFECVLEVLEVKHQVYQALEDTCPNLKAICSVSSALVVDLLREGMEKYRSKILVTHPFNPPHMVPYFELDAGSETEPQVVEFVRELLESMGRKPVLLKKSAPGFIGNRLQFALWREAVHIVDSGIADSRDVDTCLMYSFCPRYTSIGIFEHFDNGGLDLNLNTCKSIFPDLCNDTTPPEAVSQRVARGDLGYKTGKGFYDWTGVDHDAFQKRVTEPYWGFFNWTLPTE